MAKGSLGSLKRGSGGGITKGNFLPDVPLSNSKNERNEKEPYICDV